MPGDDSIPPRLELKRLLQLRHFIPANRYLYSSCGTVRITRSPRAILHFNNHDSATRRASDGTPGMGVIVVG